MASYLSSLLVCQLTYNMELIISFWVVVRVEEDNKYKARGLKTLKKYYPDIKLLLQVLRNLHVPKCLGRISWKRWMLNFAGRMETVGM